MNKLKTDINGQYPFFLDDLRWIDEGLREAFKAVFAAYGEDKFIISGCELTYDSGTINYICTEGYVYIDGEILYCAGGTAMSDETHTPVFDLQVSYTNSLPGLKTFGDGFVHDTYEIRQAVYHDINPNNIGVELIAVSAKRLHELIYSNIKLLPEWVAEMALYAKKQQGGWTIVTPSSEFDFTAIADADKLKYRKDQFGQLQIVGNIAGGVDPSGAEMCQIPNIALLSERLINVFVDNSGTRSLMPCWLEVNGKIRIKSLDGTVSPGGIAYFNVTIPLD